MEMGGENERLFSQLENIVVKDSVMRSYVQSSEKFSAPREQWA